MVLVISQETFDDAVKENINEFSMTPEEAIQEAVTQFKAQGIDLSNIVTSLAVDDNAQKIKHIIGKIKKANETESWESDEVIAALNEIKAECDIDIAHRVLAGKHFAYGNLVKMAKKLDGKEPINLVLKALTSLMSGQPDLLEENGIWLMLSLLGKEDANFHQQTLMWMRQCVTKHEHNRQALMEAEIAPLIVNILSNENSPGILVQEACKVTRAMVLDDDIRVPYGKAHEHARIFAGDLNVLDILTNLLSRFKTDRVSLFEILATMSSLTVRHEFCQAVDKAGGLQLILDVLVSYPENEKLERQCMKLLRGLSGNDDVKHNIVDAGVLPLIVSAMTRHEGSPTVTSAACSLIASLTLRSPANSVKAHEAGVEDAIVQIMKVHSGNPDVLRLASLAIRNMVSRSKELCEPFLKLGVADLLFEAIKNHKVTCEANAKGALRDLGCPVEFQEEWKGKINGPLIKN